MKLQVIRYRCPEPPSTLGLLPLGRAEYGKVLVVLHLARICKRPKKSLAVTHYQSQTSTWIFLRTYSVIDTNNKDKCNPDNRNAKATDLNRITLLKQKI